MNNQFATQFLLEDLEDSPNDQFKLDIESLVQKAMSLGMTEEEAL